MNKRELMLIATSVSGNSLEWYDFALYGYFASILAKLFFSTQNTYTSLIFTFGVFSTGFVVRPVGAAIFGYIGDKHGRRSALVMSIILITIPTALIGILPTYSSIGIIAPILLTILRLLQGIAVSGELTGSGAFLIESSLENKKGLYGSLIMCSTYLGLLIGSIFGYVITIIYNQREIEMFAWRIPFLLSFLLGLIALILRLKCKESPLFIDSSINKKLLASPIKYALSKYLEQSLLIFALSSLLAVVIYLIIGYLPAFYVTKIGFSMKESMLISFVGLSILSFLVPIFGVLSDRYDKKTILSIGIAYFIILAYPIFVFLSSGKLITTFFGEAMMVLGLSPIAGTIITVMSEMFPTPVRFTGMAIGYNSSMAVFGGTTPLISLYLSEKMNNINVPAFYVIVCGFVSFIALLVIKRRCANYLVY